MNIPFLDNWRKRHGGTRAAALAAAVETDPDGVAELFAECELLRSQAAQCGLELDDSPASLSALDQLPPIWRDDPEELPWVGNDAGLYLGTGPGAYGARRRLGHPGRREARWCGWAPGGRSTWSPPVSTGRCRAAPSSPRCTRRRRRAGPEAKTR